MARRGQVIENAITGERIGFRRTAADSGGAELEIEATWNARQVPQPEHRHPEAEETIEVLSGRISLSVAEEERLLEKGESASIPAGVLHFAHNPDEERAAHVRIRFRPALRMEEFLERSFAIASAMRDDEDRIRMPAPGRLSELISDFRREFSMVPLANPDADRPKEYLRYAKQPDPGEAGSG